MMIILQHGLKIRRNIDIPTGILLGIDHVHSPVKRRDGLQKTGNILLFDEQLLQLVIYDAHLTDTAVIAVKLHLIMPHGRFSPIDRLVQRLPVRALRHADRDLIPHLTDCVTERRKAFCKLLRLTRRTQQDKLITADTVCAVVREILPNPVRNRAQHMVAGLMSQVVVDLM